MADIEFFVDLTDGRELIINEIINFGYVGSLFALTLGSAQVGVGSDGKLQKQMAIVARVRFDLNAAKGLRDALDQNIAAFTPPANEKPN